MSILERAIAIARRGLRFGGGRTGAGGRASTRGAVVLRDVSEPRDYRRLTASLDRGDLAKRVARKRPEVVDGQGGDGDGADATLRCAAGVAGQAGDFTVSLRQETRYVNPER